MLKLQQTDPRSSVTNVGAAVVKTTGSFQFSSDSHKTTEDKAGVYFIT